MRQQPIRERRLPFSTGVAWNALTDVEVLKACIPGCVSLTAMSPTEFAVIIVTGIGPIRTTVKGVIELQRHGDADPPASYTLRFDGSGRFIGRAQGEAQVQLRPDADGRTILSYGTKARVSGRLAAAGAPIIDVAVQELAEDFFDRFRDYAHKFEREAQTAPAG
jgi:carbon monoxide dehydrogenase subunit G